MGSSSTRVVTQVSQLGDQVLSAQEQLFNEHLRDEKRIKAALTSICVRASYLQYGWAQALAIEVKTMSPVRLYQLYCTILRDNCRRTVMRPFRVPCFQAKFYQQFEANYAPKQAVKSNTTIGKENSKSPRSIANNQGETANFKKEEEIDIAAALQECKSYLMVLKWLSELVDVRKGDKRLQNKEDYNVLLDFEPKMVQILTNLFKADLEKNLNSNSFYFDLDNTMRPEREVITMTRQFAKEKSMRLLSTRIETAAANLKSKGTLDTVVRQIVEMVGIRMTYPHLRIMRELGTGLDSDVWNIVKEYHLESANASQLSHKDNSTISTAPAHEAQSSQDHKDAISLAEVDTNKVAFDLPPSGGSAIDHSDNKIRKSSNFFKQLTMSKST